MRGKNKTTKERYDRGRKKENRKRKRRGKKRRQRRDGGRKIHVIMREEKEERGIREGDKQR